MERVPLSRMFTFSVLALGPDWLRSQVQTLVIHLKGGTQQNMVEITWGFLVAGMIKTGHAGH